MTGCYGSVTGCNWVVTGCNMCVTGFYKGVKGCNGAQGVKTQLLLLGKFEYTGGPIFKVVLEC